jgi:hypothetical protein
MTVQTLCDFLKVWFTSAIDVTRPRGYQHHSAERTWATQENRLWVDTCFQYLLASRLSRK